MRRLEIEEKVRVCAIGILLTISIAYVHDISY